MNKKKLPRAIRPADDYMDAAAVPGSAENARAIDGAAAGFGFDGNGSPAGTAALPLPLADNTRSNLNGTGANAARRRLRARAIVERHAAYSAVGGIIPLPIVNVAGITTIIVRMVKALSGLYDVPFERDRARTIVIGLLGGTMPTGLAAVATSTLVYLLPGSNVIGLAVSSMTALACTRGIGSIFIDHFESGATLQDLSATERI